MYLQLNDPSNAKDDANGVIHIHPTWWRGYARLAQSYEKLKKFEKAVKNYELALQMNPPDVHSSTLTDSMYYCQRMLGKLNRMESIQPHNCINSLNEVIDEANKQLGRPGTLLDETIYRLQQSLISKNNLLQSDPVVICAEGHKFLRGIDGPRDFELAAGRFAKAANKGSADGMYNLGILLTEGKGIKRDTQRGIDMFKQAAVQPSFIFRGDKNYKLKNEGVSEAKHALGLAYYEGSGVPKNIKTAFSWWSRAFEEDGNGASANNIGIMYEEGEFVSPDIEKAIIHWKFAAFDGLVRAMDNLFRVYMNKRNHIEAIDWYRLAVENGSVKDSMIEQLIAMNRLGKFDSKMFVEKFTEELKESRFRQIVLRCEQTTKNMTEWCKIDIETPTTDRFGGTVPKSNAAFIVEHREFFQQMRNMIAKEKKNQAVSAAFTHPPNLKGKQNVNVLGLKAIYFKDMDAKVDKIYEGFAIKIVIIDDAIVGQPSVNLIGQDDDGNMQRIFIYNIPQNKETQDVVGFGCAITIVNPYHRIAADGKPMIRVDNPSTIVYHTALTNKKRCRYCGNTNGTILCKLCERAFYCSQNCLKSDSTENQHKLVCVKKL